MSGYSRDLDLGITVPIDPEKEIVPENLKVLIHEMHSLLLELSIRVPEDVLKLYAPRINRATKVKLAWVGEEKKPHAPEART